MSTTIGIVFKSGRHERYHRINSESVNIKGGYLFFEDNKGVAHSVPVSLISRCVTKTAKVLIGTELQSTNVYNIMRGE